MLFCDGIRERDENELLTSHFVRGQRYRGVLTN
jgi:hypothetical protein